MKSFIFATLTILALSSSAFADSSPAKTWALGVLKYNDSRIDLYSCGTSDGTYAFTKPNANTLYTCGGQIVGTERNVILVQFGSKYSVFEVGKCGTRTGIGMQEGGDTKQTCEITALDTESLQPVGGKGTILYHTTWEYSEGSTQIEIKLSGVKIEGVLVDFDTLKDDSSL